MPPGVLREPGLLASAVMMSGLRGLYGRFWFLLLQMCDLLDYFGNAPKAESGILRFERCPTLSPMRGFEGRSVPRGSKRESNFCMLAGLSAA